MSQMPGSDPLDALQAADPVDEDHLPSASLARIRARVTEDIRVMEADTKDRRPSLRTALGVGAVLVASLAVVFIVGRPGSPTGVGPEPTPGGVISASCVELYSLETLANREHAFDGTVTAIDGERVSFAVNKAYKGVKGDSITLDAPGMTGNAITSAGGPNFVDGGRYLVAGDEN